MNTMCIRAKRKRERRWYSEISCEDFFIFLAPLYCQKVRKKINEKDKWDLPFYLIIRRSAVSFVRI